MIIVNQYGEFVQAGTRAMFKQEYPNATFVQEYPDATELKSISVARKIISSMKRSGQWCATYYLVTNYGLESETKQRIG